MTDNHYLPPKAELADPPMLTEHTEYAGFWVRVVASIIDTILVILITWPLLVALYGMAYFETEEVFFIHGPGEFLISYVMPAVAVVAFWVWKQATPGKLILGARVVDARTGQTLSTTRAIVRYLGYFVSMIPLGLGLLWVAFDPRKQGWHDKIAGSVVVTSR
jgi:uncharacterized RDD family membrane protein YckC